MEKITRGTTPTIEIEVDADLTDYTCELSIGKYGKPYCTANNEQMTMRLGEEGTVCSFKLTQEQTLACKPGVAMMQMRSVRDGDAVATEVEEIEVLNVIEQSVIEDTFDTPIG